MHVPIMSEVVDMAQTVRKWNVRREEQLHNDLQLRGIVCTENYIAKRL